MVRHDCHDITFSLIAAADGLIQVDYNQILADCVAEINNYLQASCFPLELFIRFFWTIVNHSWRPALLLLFPALQIVPQRLLQTIIFLLFSQFCMMDLGRGFSMGGFIGHALSPPF